MKTVQGSLSAEESTGLFRIVNGANMSVNVVNLSLPLHESVPMTVQVDFGGRALN